MVDLTRRHTVKLLGAAAAASFTVSDQLGAVPAPSGSSLFDRVATSARHFHAIESDALLDGVYAQLFRKVPSRRVTETVVKVDVPQHVRLKEPNKSRETFIWNFSADEYGFGFYVVRDDDPRKVISAPGLDAPSRPVRVSDLGTALRALTRSFQQMREIDAAHVFNTAQTYDASVGGDGVCICSLNHPHDHGVWANTFPTQCDINGLTLGQAIEHIGQFVDERGVRINARADRLVVSPANAGHAVDAVADLARLNFERFPDYAVAPFALRESEPLVWHYLTQHDDWFVKTSIDGLLWFEREPFQIVCELDAERDAVLVTGTEKRKFGCRDPRAVFASFPSV